MFLPAIPSWLSLWSLLSPEDALDANECSREGPERDGDGPRVGVSTAGTGRGGAGSVRLVQVIAAASISYRYAVVLHFWDSVSLERVWLGHARRKGKKTGRFFVHIVICAGDGVGGRLCIVRSIC